MSSMQEMIFNYDEAVKSGVKLRNIILYIKMPTGEIETIINPNIPEKLKYLQNAYTEELVHKNCKDISIVDYEFDF